MLRGLLRDSEATKALFEKFDLFKAPELLEKYVIASEVTVEVLDVFLSRVFGSERGALVEGSSNLKGLCDILCGLSSSDRKGSTREEVSARADEHKKEVDGMRVKIENLERQLCAMQRQLQLQGDVLQLAVSLDGRLDNFVRECERRISESEEAMRGDVKLQVVAVSSRVARLEKDVGDRASIDDLRTLSEEVARLKKTIVSRVSEVEKNVSKGDHQSLSDIIEGKSEKLDVVVNMIPKKAPVYSTRLCDGNVREKGVIKVTPSCPDCESDEAKNTVVLGANSRCRSGVGPDQSLEVPVKFRPLIEAMKSMGKAMISLSDLEGQLKTWSAKLNQPIDNINQYITKAADAQLVIYDKSINYVRFRNRSMANAAIEYV